MKNSRVPSASRRQFLKNVGKAGLFTASAAVLGKGMQAGSSLAATKPNILMIMVDEERDWFWLPSNFNFASHFPARQWLRDMGVRFTNYHCHTNPCSPSRSTIYTGQHTDYTGIFDNVMIGWQDDMLPTIPTVGGILRGMGYKTAYRGKWHLKASASSLEAFGFDDWIAGEYDGIRGQEGMAMDDLIADDSAQFILDNEFSSTPWFLSVNFINPHDVAAYPSYYNMDCSVATVSDLPGYETLLGPEHVPANYKDDLSTKPGAHNYWRNFYNNFKGSVDHNDPKVWALLLNHYLYFMKQSDRHILNVLNALAESGQLENTVIVFSSDHGELGGAHGMRSKGPECYRESRNIPLIVVDPRLPHDGSTQKHRGVATKAFAGAIDLLPMLVRLADSTIAPSSRDFFGADLYGKVLSVPDPSKLTETAARASILFTYDAKQGAPRSGSGSFIQYGLGYLRGILGYDYRGNLVKYARYFEPGHANDALNRMQWELYDYTADGSTAELKNRLTSYYPPAPYRKVRDDMNSKLNSLISKEMRNSNASAVVNPPPTFPEVGCQR